MRTCAEMSEILSAYIDGQETAEEAMHARVHLEACGSCRAMVADWQAIGDAIPKEEPSLRVVEGAPARGPRAGRTWARRTGTGPRASRQWVSKLLVAAAMTSLAAGSALVAQVSTEGARERREQQALSRPSDSSRDRGDDAPSTDGAPGSLALEVAEPPESGSSEGAPGTGDAKPAPRESSSSEGGSAGEPPTAADEGGSARGADGGLELTIITDRTHVKAGDKVGMRLILRNVTDHDVIFEAPEESPMDVIVTADGEQVWRRSRDWSGATVVRTLAPGKTIEEELVYVAEREGSFSVYGECRCSPANTGTDGSPSLRSTDGATFSSSAVAPAPTTKTDPVDGPAPFKTSLLKLIVTS